MNYGYAHNFMFFKIYFRSEPFKHLPVHFGRGERVVGCFGFCGVKLSDISVVVIKHFFPCLALLCHRPRPPKPLFPFYFSTYEIPPHIRPVEERRGSGMRVLAASWAAVK